MLSCILAHTWQVACYVSDAPEVHSFPALATDFRKPALTWPRLRTLSSNQQVSHLLKPRLHACLSSSRPVRSRTPIIPCVIFVNMAATLASEPQRSQT